MSIHFINFNQQQPPPPLQEPCGAGPTLQHPGSGALTLNSELQLPDWQQSPVQASSMQHSPPSQHTDWLARVYAPRFEAATSESKAAETAKTKDREFFDAFMSHKPFVVLV